MTEDRDDTMDDDFDEEEFEPDDEFEEVERDDYAPRARKSDQRMAALALLYSVIALTFVWFHGAPDGLSPDMRRLTWMGINFLVLFCVPTLIVRFVWRRPLADFGLQWGDFATWGRYFAVYLLFMLPIVIYISRTPDFHAYYPRFPLARISLGWFILAHLGWLVYFFAWEWFYRGFLLFALTPACSAGIAIFVQMVPFAMMHFPKLEAEAWSSIACGLALGLMAFRGKSFIGCWLLHWVIKLLMNLSVVLWPLA